MNVSGMHGDLLKTVQFQYVDGQDEPRAYLLQEGVSRYAALDQCLSRLRAARDKAATDAIKNLGRYKFSNFGYHAARWVTLNALIGDKQPNPFRELVECAKAMIARKAAS